MIYDKFGNKTIKNSKFVESHDGQYYISYEIINGTMSNIWSGYNPNGYDLNLEFSPIGKGEMYVTVPKKFFKYPYDAKFTELILIQDTEFIETFDEDNINLKYSFTQDESIIEFLMTCWISHCVDE